jgi:tetratricopeptide (TPR) repeat protein
MFHAEYLRRTNDLGYARRVMEVNLQICERNHWAKDISDCHRVLGDLDFDSGNYEFARVHYESALKIARSISGRDILIEALLARGRFYARVAVGAGSPRPESSSHPGSGDPTPTINNAFTDLNEALHYAVEGGYRIYEADIRVALGWAYLANGEREKAKESAQRALQMSQEMGYHCGKVDAGEVMQRMKD